MEAASIPAMICSAASAGCVAEVASLPLDTAKVRMQISGGKGNLFTTLRHVVAQEGIRAPYKGLTAGLHRQLVFCTFRISMYGPVKDLFCRDDERAAPPLYKKIAAAMTTGALGMCMANPTDMVKIRLQADRVAASSGEARYKGALDAYRTIVREESLRGLWRGLGPNIVRNSVICAAELASYDQIKQSLITRNLIKDGPACHVSCGLAAGFVATVVGSPVDVVKTRYMNAAPNEYSSVITCASKLMQNRGIPGFYQGFWPNFMRIGWFNVVVFLTYENVLKNVKSLV